MGISAHISISRNLTQPSEQPPVNSFGWEHYRRRSRRGGREGGRGGGGEEEQKERSY